MIDMAGRIAVICAAHGTPELKRRRLRDEHTDSDVERRQRRWREFWRRKGRRWQEWRVG